MSKRIGVRELKNQASQVIRAVREDMAEYVVTLRGEPVAILKPLTAEEAHRLQLAQSEQAMQQLKDLAQEVAAAWPSGKSAVELISQQRR